MLQQTNSALQLDEPLTHGNDALLMMYVRFVSSTTDSLWDEYLFSDFLGDNIGGNFQYIVGIFGF